MAKNVMQRLVCPRCNTYYENDDPVMLDKLNSVLHQECYSSKNREIKDRGSYREILENYDFFSELRVAMNEVK